MILWKGEGVTKRHCYSSDCNDQSIKNTGACDRLLETHLYNGVSGFL